MYQDGVLINNGTGNIFNNTNFSSEGIYNISVVYHATQNYSADVETWFLNVSDVTGDGIPPTFTNIANFSEYNNITFNYELNATDETLFDCFSFNDTTNFNISCDGFINNVTDVTLQKEGVEGKEKKMPQDTHCPCKRRDWYYDSVGDVWKCRYCHPPPN